MLAVDASGFYAAHPHIPRTLFKATKKMVGSNRDMFKWLEDDGPGGSRIGIVAGHAPVESGPDPAVASAKGNSCGSATVSTEKSSKRSKSKATDAIVSQKARKHFVENESKRFRGGLQCSSYDVEVAKKMRSSSSKAMKGVLRDRTLWLEMMERGRHAAWLAADQTLRLDSEFTRTLVSKAWQVFPYIDESVLTAAMVMEVARKTITVFEMLPKSNAEPDGRRLYVLDDAALDKQAAIDAVTTSWWTFAFVPDALKRDQDVIFAAMDSHRETSSAQISSRDRYVYRPDGGDIKCTPECVLELLPEIEVGVALKSVNTESTDVFTPISRLLVADQTRLLNRKEVVLAACEHSPDAAILSILRRISPDCTLLDEEAVVMHALTFGLGYQVLQSASDRLKGGKQVVQAAVMAAQRGGSTCDNPFQYASDALKADKAFVLGMLQAVNAAKKSPASNLDHFPCFLEIVEDLLKADKDVVLAVLRLDASELGYRFKHLPEALRLDKDVAEIAVTQGGIVTLRYLDRSFGSDRDLWRLILTLHPIEFTETVAGSEMHRGADGDFYTVPCDRVETVNVLKHAPLEIRADEELALIAARCADSSSDHIAWREMSLKPSTMLARKLPMNRSVLRMLLTVAIRHTPTQNGMCARCHLKSGGTSLTLPYFFGLSQRIYGT